MHWTRRRFLTAMAGAAGVGTSTARVALAGAGETTPLGGSDDFETVRVPRDHETIAAGVEAADPGDLVLVGEGTYSEVVEVETPQVTIRGVDRNAVVLDGGFERSYGVEALADGVAVENLTARHYTDTGVYWTGVEGFRGSYLTAYNNGNYGIYAYRASDGRFEHSYASGHPDAGFYLGRNDPFHAVVENVVAEYNGMGYSGTSAGGDLTVRDSVWRHNQSGIVPNTLDEVDEPQRGTRIVNNEVHDNDATDAASKRLVYPAFGTGILLWGGSENLVANNEVRDHENFGVALEPNVVPPSGNVVRENEIEGSGEADLALGTPVGEDNRFVDNEFDTAAPADVEADASEGDSGVTAVFAAQERRAERGEFPSGNWRTRPEPDDRPTMADPTAPPLPAEKDESLAPPSGGSNGR